MAISFDNALGIHEDALRFRGHRAAVLANNLANTDTPGYKARDMDFQSALANKMQPQNKAVALQTTHASHKQARGLEMGDGGLMYRTPQQPSIDGNTVEEQVEHAQYMENSLAFQASFTFINGRFKGLMNAIKGQ